MSQNRASKTVRILNPVAGPGYTSRKKALEYVAQGRAEIAGPSAIRFVERDYRHLAAHASQEPRAAFDAIQNLPVCGRDAVQLITANRRTPKRTPLQAKAAARIRHFGPRNRLIEAA